MNLLSMRFYAEYCECVNKCWDEFEAIFSGTVYHHTSIKLLIKKILIFKLKQVPGLWVHSVNNSYNINNKDLIKQV